jgi:adenylylsulfate kinase-like enzyme
MNYYYSRASSEKNFYGKTNPFELPEKLELHTDTVKSHF